MQYSLQISNLVDRVAGPGTGSGSNETQVLLALQQSEFRTRHELLEITGMSRSGLAQLLERQSRLGLVENFTDPRDHRRVVSRLTALGRRRIDDLNEALRQYFFELNPLVAELLDLHPEMRPVPDPSATPFDSLGQIADLGARLSEPLGAVIGPSDLRQRLALAVLADWGEARPSQLIAELGLTTGGTTYLVDGLERAGLVERRYGTIPNDRRSVVIRLTPSGQAAAEEFADVMFERAEEIADTIARAHGIR
jgi:DNA-binding MarR family transcriptional regulator